MSVKHALESKFAAAWPPSVWADVTVLVAVSGGCDSVALLRAMAALKTGGEGGLCVAHFNHHLREAADDDERFVADLCRRLGLPCQVGHVSEETLTSRAKDGLEAAARVARYRFLQKTAGRVGARYVVTAHTADDQAETVLHRVLRGTGVRGLAGIQRVRPLGHATLIRPMLGIRRDELRQYLDALEQPFRDDASNFDVRFTRNRIRRRLLPWLQKHFNGEIGEALVRLGALAGEAQAVIDPFVEELFDRHVTADTPHAVTIQRQGLTRQPPYLVRELLMAVWRRQGWPMQAMGWAQWEELRDMAASDSPPARRVLPAGIIVEVDSLALRIRR